MFYGALGKVSDAAFLAVVARMKRTYDRVQPENVIVGYRHLGLGFSANPLGSDIISTVPCL